VLKKSNKIQRSSNASRQNKENLISNLKTSNVLSFLLAEQHRTKINSSLPTIKLNNSQQWFLLSTRIQFNQTLNKTILAPPSFITSSSSSKRRPTVLRLFVSRASQQGIGEDQVFKVNNSIVHIIEVK
jgi:hypothetical protein